jgi:hypothetical protein
VRGGDQAVPEADGIACAACHAVHAPGQRPAPALLRETTTPGVPASAGRGALCLSCHAPSNDGASAVWLGRGGLDPRTGASLAGPAPHAAIEGGCVACHRGPDGGGRGSGHTFAASAAACRGCHGPLERDAGLRDRALRLWTALGNAAPQPPHASGTAIDRATPRGRAAWNVRLVLEDPAAAAHNPRYARRLLDAAEQVLR